VAREEGIAVGEGEKGVLLKDEGKAGTAENMLNPKLEGGGMGGLALKRKRNTEKGRDGKAYSTCYPITGKGYIRTGHILHLGV
jgi:hypothetical protein